MRVSLGKADYSLFMPPNNLEASVFCAAGLDADQLAAIGRTVVGQPVKGHALVPLAAITDRGLRVVPDPKPHELHANIVGWTADKPSQRAHAKAIADASRLTVYSATN